MSDEPIPLYDGEPTGAVIRHETSTLKGSAPAAGGAVQVRRKAARHDCERILVCFTPQDPTRCAENVNCPVVNLSKGGIALEYDRKMLSGISCFITYRTVSQQAVHISGVVRHCRDIGGGHYQLGIKFTRNLRIEELKPAKFRPGRDVAPGLHARNLKLRTDQVEQTEPSGEKAAGE